MLTDYGTRKKILALSLALILALGTRVATQVLFEKLPTRT